MVEEFSSKRALFLERARIAAARGEEDGVHASWAQIVRHRQRGHTLPSLEESMFAGHVTPFGAPGFSPSAARGLMLLQRHLHHLLGVDNTDVLVSLMHRWTREWISSKDRPSAKDAADIVDKIANKAGQTAAVESMALMLILSRLVWPRLSTRMNAFQVYAMNAVWAGSKALRKALKTKVTFSRELRRCKRESHRFSELREHASVLHSTLTSLFPDGMGLAKMWGFSPEDEDASEDSPMRREDHTGAGAGAGTL